MMQAAYIYDDVLRCASQFTGKERDSETGLDYFGARYYGSDMGRWLSPDWAAKPEPIPYAKLGNPQSLNLYGYVLNNPATNRDPDGHWCWKGIGTTCNVPPPPPQTPDPAKVRPDPAPAPKPAPPKRGLTYAVGVAGNAEAGASRAGGSGANGSVVVVRSISTDGKVSTGVAASGGAAMTAGDFVAGAPKQETTPDIVGAYAGGGVAFQLSNAGSVQQLAGPFQTIAGNVGGGQGASVSLSFDHTGTFVFQITVGPGLGVSGYSMTTTTAVGCMEGCN